MTTHPTKLQNLIAIAISVIAFIDIATAIMISAIAIVILAIKDAAEQVSICVRMSDNRIMQSLLTLQQSNLVALTTH